MQYIFVLNYLNDNNIYLTAADAALSVLDALGLWSLL